MRPWKYHCWKLGNMLFAMGIRIRIEIWPSYVTSERFIFSRTKWRHKNNYTSPWWGFSHQLQRICKVASENGNESGKAREWQYSSLCSPILTLGLFYFWSFWNRWFVFLGGGVMCTVWSCHQTTTGNFSDKHTNSPYWSPHIMLITDWENMFKHQDNTF